MVGEGWLREGVREEIGGVYAWFSVLFFEGYRFFMMDGMDVDMNYLTTHWLILSRIYWYLLVVWGGERVSGSLEYTNTQLSNPVYIQLT